ELSTDGLLTLRGRKKDMLALPDGQKVYPEDVEEVLDEDSRLKGSTVVGWPLGENLKVHAVIVLADGVDASGSNGGADSVASDLNMDSLQRVELLGMIEEELGVYIDDADLDPDATVEAVVTMIEERHDAKRETGIYGWPLNPGVRLFGLGFQALVMVPLVHLFYRVRRSGTENLEGLEGPVLFTPNHCLHSANAIVLTQLPL